MSDTDKAFTGSIPEIYDDFLVPLIFDSFANDLARRVAALSPKSVLETAAGSGVVTRALAPHLKRDARFTVTDLNQPMLDRAADKQPTDHRINWHQADASRLPFENKSFEVACCQFGVMFFPDKLAAFSETLRVLQDGGHFVFSVWDKIEENEFAHSVTETVTRLYPDDPPVFLARTPHGYHDITDITRALRTVGFRNVDVHTIAEQSRADSPRVPALAYCQGTPLRNELEKRDPGALENITDAAAADIERAYGSGPVSAKIQGHVFVATS